MGVEGMTKCLKYLMFIFNFFFFFLGCALIGIGVWAEVNVGPYIQLSSVDYATGPRILIAVGIIIAVVSFLGCCGAWKESKCMLSLFFTLLVILMILEIAACVLAFMYRDKVKTVLTKDIEDNIKKFPDANLKAINDLQAKFECCGATGPDDWIINAEYNKTDSVPDSCCKASFIDQDCGKGQRVKKSKIYTQGCSTKLQDMIAKNLKPTAALAITTLVIQILGAIFAIVLICRID